MDNIYTYVSTRASYDPAKTIFICPSSEDAKTYEQAKAFAETSGWETLAEYDGAVLVIPVVPGGWTAVNTGLPGELFDTLRGSFSSRNGKSLLGRGGKLWCWETLFYIVGYGDGAEFAGDCVIANPGRFAAAALVGGGPGNFEAGNLPSGHWLVKDVSADYVTKNSQIPSCVWLLGAEPATIQKALDYFTPVNHLGRPENICLEGISAQRRCNPENPAEQLLISEGSFNADLSLSRAILGGLFDKVIRWKNGPDGRLKLHPGRAGFYASPRFIQESITVNALDYPYVVHLPDGMGKEEAVGLPVVFSVHGRGEPAWLFTEKNGWDMLADATREFVLVVPDSPGNIWQMFRDEKAFTTMVHKICRDYKLDATRVYLTGFSNGAMFAREMGTRHPELFAGISPWNGPFRVPEFSSREEDMSQLLFSGCELPCWIYVGDNDPATQKQDIREQLDILLKANRCAAQESDWEDGGYVPDEIRTGQNGYERYNEGDRFYTRIYCGPDGAERVGYTIMKNMPHGAIIEQSRAAWRFLKKFRRPQGSMNVICEK